MKGLDSLVKMRLEGRIPSLLYVDIDTEKMPGEGHLQIEQTEPIYGLDLRAVQGLVVSVSGCSAPRVAAIAGACSEAGARRVIAHTMELTVGGEFKVTKVTDTDGLFTWSRG